MNYYVFQLGDAFGETADTYFKEMALEGKYFTINDGAAYIKEIGPEDKIVFYFISPYQEFVGIATVASFPYKPKPGKARNYVRPEEEHVIDLKDTEAFPNPISILELKYLEYKPGPGAIKSISKADYDMIVEKML